MNERAICVRYLLKLLDKYRDAIRIANIIIHKLRSPEETVEGISSLIDNFLKLRDELAEWDILEGDE